MNQKPKHTETSPSSYDAATYGYEYRYNGFGGSAQVSQSAAWSRTLTEHRGSSWITDGSGNACTERSRSVNQHLQYLPFGEQFIDQRKDHDIRYKFTTKEEDSETGYQYFGARYYASDLSIWLSVDPLASKYPGISPYAYVYNNPVMFIDKWGLEGDPPDGVYHCYSCDSKPSEDLNYFKAGNNNNTQNNYTPNPAQDFMRAANRQRFLATSPFLNRSTTGNTQSTTDGSTSDEGVDPISGGIFAAGINISMIQGKLSTVNNSFNALQSESKALGLGLDYTSELAKMGKIIKIARFTGYAVGAAGVLWDANSTFGKNPKMSVAKFTLNTTMTIIGFMGVPGAVVGGLYFGVDTFVPGGWETVSKNQYDMYMMHVQDGVMMSPWIMGPK